MKTQIEHARLESQRLIAQVRGEVKRQRDAAEDELRRVTEGLTATIGAVRAKAATDLEDAVQEARVAAETEAAGAQADAVREHDRALQEARAEAAATIAAALAQAQADADERLVLNQVRFYVNKGEKPVVQVVRQESRTPNERLFR